LKQSRQFFVFGLLAGVAITSLAFSEEVMAIVEPHITINMDPGQTTKPFVINDDTSSEVFSVDPEGTISSQGLRVLSFEQGPVIETTNVGIDNAVELAKWRIDFASPPTQGDKPPIRVVDAYVSGQIKTTNVASFAFFGYAISTDDTTWSLKCSIGTSQLVLRGDFCIQDQDTIFDETTSDVGYISVRLFTNSLPESMQVKNAIANIIIVLPEGATITRVI